MKHYSYIKKPLTTQLRGRQPFISDIPINLMHHNPVEHRPYLNTPKLSPVLETILGHATWAPSGDNIQPWRITPLTSTSCSLTVVYGDDNIFDLDHASTHMALGTFIETACIAAVTHGYEPLVECVVPGTDTPPHVHLYNFSIGGITA